MPDQWPIAIHGLVKLVQHVPSDAAYGFTGSLRTHKKVFSHSLLYFLVVPFPPRPLEALPPILTLTLSVINTWLKEARSNFAAGVQTAILITHLPPKPTHRQNFGQSETKAMVFLNPPDIDQLADDSATLWRGSPKKWPKMPIWTFLNYDEVRLVLDSL